MKLSYQFTATALSTALRQSLLGMVREPENPIEKPSEPVCLLQNSQPETKK